MLRLDDETLPFLQWFPTVSTHLVLHHTLSVIEVSAGLGVLMLSIGLGVLMYLC